jgi:crotonobetainyl-CoA:carnitine CoA-transferase CaiB-like acyl-CoA transferase
LSDLFEAKGLPFAPIKAPHELIDDPHIMASGGMEKITLPDGERAGETVDTILFPFKMDGAHLGVRRNPPRLGEHTHELLREVGYSSVQIDAMAADKKVRHLS